MKKLIASNSIMHQMMRYGITGIVTNGFGYLIYLFVTFFWLDPKVAITMFYPLGAAVGYFSYSKYSFVSSRNIKTLFRYIVAYLIGYSVNFILLVVFSDKLAFPHQMVQALSILVVASLLFFILKYFVFPTSIVK